MKQLALCYLELVQPVKALNDPQIKSPRPKPMVFITGTTAMFPVTHRRKVLFFNTENTFVNGINFYFNFNGNLWDLDKFSEAQFLILKNKITTFFAFKPMIMIAKRMRLRAKSYKKY